MAWELSKENVQPLRKGRKVETLNETLQAKEESPTQSKMCESQRRTMIEAIDNYEGDDPLHPWLQLVRWVKDAYPAGGYQSELLPVVEACTRTFQDDERYKSDIRYLRVWVLYADLCKEPQEIYQFLEARSIGQEHALFYEAYATYKELCKSHSKANEIYELGLRRGAQPTTRLQSMYQSFLKRMMQRNERKLQEDKEDSFEPDKLRHFGDTKISQARASARYPSFNQDQQRRKIQQPQVPRTGMEIFVDDEFQSGARPPSISKASSLCAPGYSSHWKNLGTQKEVKKENDQLPAKWTETKVPRIGKVQKHVDVHPSIEVFVDEDCAEAHARLKARNAAVSSTTLRQRVDGVCDLRRDQEALQKNPLLHFAESEKPSTASLLRRDPRGSTREQAADGSENGSGEHLLLVGSEIYKAREDGHESSFEEARLSKSKMHLHSHIHSSVSSPRMSAEKAKLIEKSLNMFQTKSDWHQSLSSTVTDKEPSRASHRTSSDDSSANSVPRELTGSSNSRISSSASSVDEAPAFACTMPTPQSSVNGEETIAIKRYAEDLITNGGTGSELHHGLIDQTMTSKECLQDIISMFNRPLSCENPSQRKARVTTNTSRPVPRDSNPGFNIFIDDPNNSFDAPRLPHNHTRGACAVFNDEENDPNQSKMGSSFHVFVDEELNGPPPPMKKISKPFEVFQDEEILREKPTKGSFEVFVDEDVKGIRPPPPSRKPSSRAASIDVFVDDAQLLNTRTEAAASSRATPKQSTSGSGSFQVYTDDEAPRNIDRRIPKSKPVSKPTGGFSVFVDEDVIASQPVRKPRGAPSTRR